MDRGQSVQSVWDFQAREWQLKGDKQAAKMFVGKDCSRWSCGRGWCCTMRATASAPRSRRFCAMAPGCL